MSDYQTIRYEQPLTGVARIVLARAAKRNAQNVLMLKEIDDAFRAAAKDDTVKVVILAADGPHFSSGHDLTDTDPYGSAAANDIGALWCGYGCAGAEAHMGYEKDYYLGLSERWRNFAKPTIAAVQGKCIAGGLMLVWPCDLIIATEDAEFCDNTVDMGICGAEFFNHPWEFGVRQAKELLFTASSIGARRAMELGMVNHVVPGDQLEVFALELAAKIAEKPLFALKLIKEAVNVAQDAQGRVDAMKTSFALHQLAHSHCMELYGLRIDPSFLEKSGFSVLKT